MRRGAPDLLNGDKIRTILVVLVVKRASEPSYDHVLSVSFGGSAANVLHFLTWPRPFVFFGGHLVVNSVGYMTEMSLDPSTIAILRRALDEVLLDARFYRRKSGSALEIAEHLLARAADGERDLERLKSSAFEKLIGNAERFPNQAA